MNTRPQITASEYVSTSSPGKCEKPLLVEGAQASSRRGSGTMQVYFIPISLVSGESVAFFSSRAPW